MKLLSTPTEIDKEFRKNLQSYDSFYAMVAWAGVNFSAFKLLMENLLKCRKVIVGTHFYQTHPDFMAAVSNSRAFRFVRDTSELFHPKVYLFLNSDQDWKLMIGSANFTSAAFSRNTEIVSVTSSDEEHEKSFIKKLISTFDKWWGQSSQLTEKELDDYRAMWLAMKLKQNSLSGKYSGRSKRAKNPMDVEIFTDSWSRYMSKLNKHKGSFERRLRVLEIAHDLFTSHDSFRDIPDEARKFIAGIPNSFDQTGESDWRDFGTVTGWGIFKSRIKNNAAKVTKAIDSIPLDRPVTRHDYELFLEAFVSEFSVTAITSATRLLAMKRPDTFLCMTAANLRKFCEAYGLPKSVINLETYWDEVVMRIRDSRWWREPTPKKGTVEARIVRVRAAMLDVIYYDYE